MLPTLSALLLLPHSLCPVTTTSLSPPCYYYLSTVVELISQCSTQRGVFSGEVFLTETRDSTPSASVSVSASSPFEYVHDIRTVAFMSEVSAVV